MVAGTVRERALFSRTGTRPSPGRCWAASRVSILHTDAGPISKHLIMAKLFVSFKLTIFVY